MESSLSALTTNLANISIGAIKINWILLLEYSKVFAWPLVVIFLCFKFGKVIAALLNRINELGLPGGIKIGIPPFQDKKQIESKPKTQEIEKIKKDLTYTQIYLGFERIYRVIFGSQIDLLKRLRSSNSGETKNNTIFFFVLAQRAFPPLANWTFDLYTSFLLNNNLIIYSNDNYFITDRGRAFLAYIEYLNFPPKNL